MSRIQDLLSLMESTNDFYLVAPGRNDRSVYIQVDDICELAMKSWLHEDVLRRQDACIDSLQSLNLVKNNAQKKAVRSYFNGEGRKQDLKIALGITKDATKRNTLNRELRSHKAPKQWESKEGGKWKSFDTVIGEVKKLKPVTINGTPNPQNEQLHELLDRIDGRRDNRNGFFHDHHQTSLSIQPQACLDAISDLYRLCELLFDDEFRAERQKPEWVVYRVQVALIRLQKHRERRGRSFQLYEVFLREQSIIKINPALGFFEYRLLHDDASTLEDSLRALFGQEILSNTGVIERVNEMKRPSLERQRERQQAEAAANASIEMWRECFGIEWTPPPTP
ncbi:MAG: hypothetical protein WCB68_17490 [Pyrinomonadaceae bacterium]